MKKPSNDKQKKLSLEDFKIQSFTQNLSDEEKNQIKGGRTFNNGCQSSIPATLCQWQCT